MVGTGRVSADTDCTNQGVVGIIERQSAAEYVDAADTVADQRSISNPIGVWFGPQDAAGQLFASKKSRGTTLVRCGNFATSLTSPFAMSGLSTRKQSKLEQVSQRLLVARYVVTRRRW